ncbi:MAG: LamG domain-containing protein [Planctomycetes bacterium]|nr:LamG domain-containing protein [Planctomycetota bacterium]
MNLTRSLSLAVVALALPGFASAQELRQFDGLDEGVPAGTLVDGQAGGAGWLGPWIGTDQFGTLLSYWALDNSPVDVGLFGATGTLVGGLYSTDTPGLAWSSHSLELNTPNTGGSDDHFELTPFVGSYAGLYLGTIAGWFKTTGTGAHAIFAASDSTEPSKELRVIVEGGTLRFDVRGDLNSYALLNTTTVVNDGRWHHFAVVVEADAEATVYIDGVPEFASGSLARQGFFRHVFDLDTMAIGRNVDSGGPQWQFPGLIDDFAIWGYPLTQSEVLDLATRLRPPSAFVGVPRIEGPAIVAGSLASAAFGSRGLRTFGDAVGGTTGLRAGRQFTPIADLRLDATYYVSCLLRREDNGPPVEGEIHLTDPGDIRGRFGWDAAGYWTCGINGYTASTIQMLDRTTYLCVFRIDSVASGSDAAFLKCYAPGDTIDATDAGFSGIGPNDWTAIALPAASGARLDTIWVTPNGPGGGMFADEFRIGTSWDAVTRAGFGSGCLGATIGQSGRPVIGGSGFTVELSGVRAGVAAVCNFGISRDVGPLGALPIDLGPVGGTGCFVLTSGEAAVGASANASGSASIALPIPNLAFLHGQAMFAQWVALDPGGVNPLPARLSDGLEILFQD